ncbi:conserved exported hypothetical protein [Candidatus Sulfopaludibacter sp. SbA3]|nr:conserved exported hypothetical protein [Candidatus Sulfopaludibacter sp. SbA3]
MQQPVRFLKSFSVISLLVLAPFTPVWPQTPAPAPAGRVAGTVTAVNASAKQISVKTDKGEAITLNTTDRSFLRRMPPGETDQKKAVAITLADVGAGDRLIASGQVSTDQKSMDARTIIIMTKGDVAEVKKKEEEDWQKRGTTGTVTGIDPTTKTVTIKVGSREVSVQPSDKTEYHRYSLDSAKFADAKPSTFAEIKVGDQVRVLGDKSADGASVKAERIVAGTFRQLAATIESIDPASGEMKVKDLATKKSLMVRVDADSTMKKLEPQMAAMLARRYAPGAQADGGPGGRGPGGGGASAGGGRSGFPRPDGQAGPGGRGPGGPGGGRGGDIGQMLDRLPAVHLTDLKTGDAVMVSTTMGSDPTKVTAIMLLAGVEPLLTASPTAVRDIMSGWNLGGGGGGGEGN